MSRRFLQEAVIIRLGKIAIFCLIILVQVFIAVNNWRLVFLGIPSWYVLAPTMVVLTVENTVKLWGLKSPRPKIACYVLDTLCLILLTVFTDGELISTLYIVILSEFYLVSENLRGSLAMGIASVVLFLCAYAISAALKGGHINIVSVVSNGFNDIVLIVLHFCIMNLTVQIYRKNKEITQALEELNESNDKLRIANRELQEVAVLEERQRIAKDIHDTAGHSITTVIMLTEAAKLTLENDPEEAKRKISAANLQAKSALEELRESVHLLSGQTEEISLRDMLLGIIHDSTDGTGIVIRSDIDDVRLCDAKRRFICNTLKEGVSNGLRHGGATAFWFELKRKEGRVEFLLSDNGCGVEIARLKEGFGLTGMHARAESLGGNVWFETEPDGGFEIHIVLPADGEEEK